MRITIVVDDQCVGVDGEYFAPLDLSQLASDIRAVQWYGEYGEVEYKTRLENGFLVKPSNMLVTDATPFQFAVDEWSTAKRVAEQAEADARAAAAVSTTQTEPDAG